MFNLSSINSNDVVAPTNIWAQSVMHAIRRDRNEIEMKKINAAVGALCFCARGKA